MSKIKERWLGVSNEYLKAFCERIGISIEDAWWIGDDPGTIAQIGDYFVGIHEMRYLVDNNISPDVFFKWYDYSLDIHTLQEEYHEIERFTSLKDINFESFAKGAPLPYSEVEIKTMGDSLKRLKAAREEFVKEFKNLSNEVSYF